MMTPIDFGADPILGLATRGRKLKAQKVIELLNYRPDPYQIFMTATSSKDTLEPS
jgi:hypothetical protein